ncbi:hypothetical protein [Hymenobacter swuensis]|uniref:Uncharacterized protein n=1 Tax=Hymenobacter swuensis DY53 TaxID=1227739 RepID=W8F0R8_9BACT|nr:hypothetical protein [Hymenobacter swuensis]AHJ98969.1 hypothetical protein Hsw_3374 [Hymenobacter swuensis DY53]
MDKILILRYQNIITGNLFSESISKDINLSESNALINAIKRQDEFRHYKSEYKFIFSKEDNDGCFGILLKKGTANVGTSYNSKGVVKEKINDWHGLPFYIYYKTQLIFIQEIKKLIKVDTLCRLLSNIDLKEQSTNNYKTVVEPIIEPGNFWPIVNNADGICELKVELAGPNLFGATKKANVLLKELKEVYNQEKFTFKLENENAKLNIPNNEFINSCLDQAESGGGSWELLALFRKKKTRVKSYDKAATMSVETIENIETLQSLKSRLIEKVKQIDDLLLKNLNKTQNRD